MVVSIDHPDLLVINLGKSHQNPITRESEKLANRKRFPVLIIIYPSEVGTSFAKRPRHICRRLLFECLGHDKQLHPKCFMVGLGKHSKPLVTTK